jgi:RNA polymerase sigma-70 factor (family 1)
LPDNINIADQALLRLIAGGDERAFTQLFEAYRANIYTTALRMTRDTRLAEEILQDVFLKVWLKRVDLPQIQNFSGWLYTIAQNQTYNACRKMSRENKLFVSISGTNELPDELMGDELLRNEAFAGILQQAVDRLPDKQREAYILIKREGLKRHEAASRLNVSPETVKSNLDQALKSIRAFCMTHFPDAYVLFLFLLFTEKKIF